MKTTQRLVSVALPLVYLAILAPIYLWGKIPNANTIIFHLINAVLLLAVSLSVDRPYAQQLGEWFNRHADTIIAFIVVIVAILFCVLNYLKFTNYGFVGEDLSKFAQSFYSTTYRHQLFTNSYARSHFGIHFSPFLFILCPAYWLCPHPWILIFAKVLSLSLSMIPVYLIARDALSKMAALVIVGSYLMSPAVFSQFLFEFYELQFAPLVIGFCLYYFLKKKKAFFFLCLIILISIREEMGMCAIALGVYSIIIKRDKSWSIPMLIIGTVSILSSYFFLIPYFNPSGKYPTVLITGRSGGLMPFQLYKNMVSIENARYSYFLLAPALFVLPFLNPSCILATPFIVGVLLSGKLLTKWIGYHYHAFVMVALFISCILSLGHFGSLGYSNKKPGEGVFLCKLCIVLMLFVATSLTCYQYIPSIKTEIMAPYGWNGLIPLAEYKQALAEAISIIPPQASIAVPRYTAPHLANRDHVLYDLPGERPDYALIDKNTKDKATLGRLNEKFLNDSNYLSNYKSIFCRNGIHLYRRKDKTR
ncbi:MAG: DUF2079 domain-containing protein [Candidatus Aureabacteria bacterium]|nr:DUF2079 domain-containing protein [Candidatus Auribacterota bacterium]